MIELRRISIKKYFLVVSTKNNKKIGEFDVLVHKASFILIPKDMSSKTLIRSLEVLINSGFLKKVKKVILKYNNQDIILKKDLTRKDLDCILNNREKI